MSSNELFVSFLERTVSSVDEDITFNSVHIQMLLASAENGFTPAQALINRVLKSYNIEWPLEYAKKKLCWLSKGAEAGCLIAKSDLAEIDSGLAQTAAATFFNGGAFQKHYSTEPNGEIQAEIGSHDGPAPAYQTQNFCNRTTSIESDPKSENYSVGQGSDAAVKVHLNLRNYEMLYMACLAGYVKDVKRLCHGDVNVGLYGKPDEITCLHWLFNFPPEEMNEVAALLIRSGADVNSHSKLKTPVTRFFFPFTWPAGTSLHWAVAASNTSAVMILLRHGIDCRSRNGVDPYRYDMNTRYLDQAGTTTSSEIFSIPPEPPEGLSALDIAVANHDWAILETIVAAGCKETGICDSDEEGYTPFHRLEDNWFGYTHSGSQFWHGAFWGSRSDRYDNILRTIKLLQVMGGDINCLTSPSKSNPRKLRNDLPGSLTPLMLAVRKADIDAARALLACGADPNIRNNIGLNVLSQLPESGCPGVSFRELGALVELLLNVGMGPLDSYPFMEWCPLVSAITSGCLEAVSLVVDAGADPSMKRLKLSTIAIIIASHSIRVDTPTIVSPQGFPQVCETRDDRVAKWIQRHILGKRRTTEMLENVDPYGGSLLHYATDSGLPKVVDLLIQAGAKVDVCRAQDSPGERGLNSYARGVYGTPLDIAIRKWNNALERMKRPTLGSDIPPTSESFFLSSYMIFSNLFYNEIDKYVRLSFSAEYFRQDSEYLKGGS